VARLPAPEAYTPKHLAEKILTSRAALEGERKQVTVLFADVKGSTELLLADRDPEDARKLLDPVLEHMMEAVHRYEGTVNQVMGDGIMALFGAPLAHEDHAVRACYAALRMQESVKRYAEGVRRVEGVPIRMRVGLHSGEVVVRAIGSDLRMDYTAVGQTTHLAARMEQMADPGTILITPETLSLAEGFIQVTSLGPLPVKGLSAPMEIYEIVGAEAGRSRLQAVAGRGLTRFVGRDPEMDQLRLTLERARSGHGQVVAIVGEPGVGKSRLYWEFTRSHRLAGALVLESRSVSYGKATSYLPIIDLLKGYFQIEVRDDRRRMREKITGKLLSLDEALRPTLPALLALLDLPVEDGTWPALDAPQRRQRTLEAVKGLLLRESQVQPLVVVVEDLHWIDSETQALLDTLVESVPTARLLLLVNYRPEYQHGWGSKTYYHQLQIAPLPAESAEALLHGLLGDNAALAPLTALLIARTAGNPFFLEEGVRALVETGVLVGERGAYHVTRESLEIQVPSTVQAVLAARIDRLPPEEKRLLQSAAVIGTDVPFLLLEAIADTPEPDLRRRLQHLQAGEFLYEARLFPELEYTFKHALTHEVAYGSLLHERRRALHARIAEAIATRYADRLNEHVEQLAHHAFKGQRWEQAVRYLHQAGTKAAARSATRDAVLWFDQALSALDRLPERRAALEQAVDIRLALRPLLTLLADLQRALDRLREAEVLAERLVDDARRGRIWAVMTNTLTMLGEMDEAVASGTRALAMAERLDDLGLRLTATVQLAQQYYFRGDFARVIELVSANLAALPSEAVYERFGAALPVSVYDRYWLVLSLAHLGRFAEAMEPAAVAIEIAEATHHPYTIGLIHSAAGLLHSHRGDWDKARALLERSVVALGAGSSVLALPEALGHLAQALAHLGETSEAVSRLREGEEVYERLQATPGRIAVALVRRFAVTVGKASFLVGRRAEARRFGELALQGPFRIFQPSALLLLGDIAAHPEQFDPEKGAEYYRRALALGEELKMRPLVAHCHRGLAGLYGRTGQIEKAGEHLTTATTMYREMDMRFYMEQAEAEVQRPPVADRR
jgi:class 3 adenylate cyclase/tetratricopeptide (TPR) repeat protein